MMITLHFTEQQVVALTGLLDGGLRHIGIRAAKDAAEIFAELERATLEARLAPAAHSGEQSAPDGGRTNGAAPT